jgi:hypothetical protein
LDAYAKKNGSAEINPMSHFFLSGEGEIRTLDTLAGITVFETAAFDHSATSPWSYFRLSTKSYRPKSLIPLRFPTFLIKNALGALRTYRNIFGLADENSVSGTHVPKHPLASVLSLNFRNLLIIQLISSRQHFLCQTRV